MAFEQKTWKDRVAEFINRRVLTKEDGTTELVTVARSEGQISTEGDAFNAETMNDLEQRIADEFSSLNDSLTEKVPTNHASAETTYGIGNTTKYGHVKLRNNLNATAYEAGEVLSAYQGAVLKNSVDEKAPTSHASSDGTYGTASQNNYGHAKVMNNLTEEAYSVGVALSAYQGKVLKGLIDGILAQYELYTISSSDATSGTNNIVKYQNENIGSGAYLIVGCCNKTGYITIVSVNADNGTIQTLLSGDENTIEYSFTTAGYLRVKQSSGSNFAVKNLIFAL